MTDSGTIQENNTLTPPKSEQEFLDMMNKAVNEGKEEDIAKLMALDLNFSSDADPSEAVGDEPPAPKAGESDNKQDADESGKDNNDSQPTEAAQNAAESRVPEQKADTTVELTPEQQKIQSMEAELHRLRSDAGRIPSLQSRLAQMEAQIRQTEAIRQTVKTSEKPQETEAEKKIKQRLQALREIDPETADLLEAMREEALSRKGPDVDELVNKFVESSSEQRTDAQLQIEFDKVMTAHPDFDNIRRHPYWHMWKERLTPAERAWAESDKSEHVIEAVNQFKRMLNGFQQPQAQPVQQQPAAVENAPVVETQTQETETAKQARERKLQGGTGGKETTIKNPNGPLDEEAVYKEVFAKTMKENGY